MPPSLKALNYNDLQLEAVGGYWRQRIKLARHQRNALLMIALSLFSTFVARQLPLSGADDTVFLFVLKWSMPVCLGFSTLLLIGMEFGIYQLNQLLTAQLLGLTKQQRDKAIELGNGIALDVLVFRKWP